MSVTCGAAATITIDADGPFTINFDATGGPGFIQIQSVGQDPGGGPNILTNGQIIDPIMDGDDQTLTMSFDLAEACSTNDGTLTNYLQFTYWEPGFNAIISQCQIYINLDCSSLPVELISFAGRASNSANILNWETALEVNNSHFEVERSSDGGNFEMIGTIEGHGNTYSNQEYDFVDERPLTNAFYRLRQVDYDGVFEYHKVIFIRNNELDDEIVVFPNPVNDRLTVAFDSNNEETVSIQISDITGRNVFTQNVNPLIFDKKVELNLSTFNPGTYFVKVTSGTIEHTQKIIKI